MQLKCGDILKSRYEIKKYLKEGGMGAIYQAYDKTLHIDVAIKENSLRASPESQRQFEVEAHILARLKHAHLPKVTDHFVIPGQGQYLVMEYIEGQSLRDIAESSGRPQTILEVRRWFDQICQALDYLHRQNPPVIHRDIKPDNIIITPEGQAILVDFGIAKIDPQSDTVRGAKGITPGYSPIEQYNNERTGAYSEVYALGATLYTMLTGETPPSVTQRFSHTPIKPLRQLNRDVPPEIEPVIFKAMEINKDDRYQSVQALHQAFVKASRDTLPDPGPEDHDQEKKEEPPPWRPWLLRLGGALIALILVITGVWLATGDNASRNATSSAGASIAEMVIEVDDQTIETDTSHPVDCHTSHRVEVKLLDANRARIQPSAFSFNWRFVPSDTINQEKLASSNYALIYQPSCDLDNQTVIVEVQEEEKTLYTRSVRFKIEQ
jgi:serine/threonine-protein kinase